MCTGYVTLSDGKRYKFTNGKKDVTKVTPAKKYNDIPGPVDNILKSGRAYNSIRDGSGKIKCYTDDYGNIYDANGNYTGEKYQ